MFQLATKTDLLRAATASGDDMIEFFVDENNKDDSGKPNWKLTKDTYSKDYEDCIMIFHEQQYRECLAKVGVGRNDNIASSIESYVSYLRSVSKILNIDISPSTVADENDIQDIYQRLQKKRNEKTISNYRSAMRQYAKMVKDLGYK